MYVHDHECWMSNKNTEPIDYVWLLRPPEQKGEKKHFSAEWIVQQHKQNRALFTTIGHNKWKRRGKLIRRGWHKHWLSLFKMCSKKALTLIFYTTYWEHNIWRVSSE